MIGERASSVEVLAVLGGCGSNDSQRELKG